MTGVIDFASFRAEKKKARADARRYPKVTVQRADGSVPCDYEVPGLVRYDRDQCSGSAAYTVSVPHHRPGYVWSSQVCVNHLASIVDLLSTREELPADAKHWGEHSSLASGGLCMTMRFKRTSVTLNETGEVPHCLGKNGPFDRFGRPGQPYVAASHCEICDRYAVAKWGKEWGGKRWGYFTKASLADARRNMGLKPIWVKT